MVRKLIEREHTAIVKWNNTGKSAEQLTYRTTDFNDTGFTMTALTNWIQLQSSGGTYYYRCDLVSQVIIESVDYYDAPPDDEIKP